MISLFWNGTFRIISTYFNFFHSLKICFLAFEMALIHFENAEINIKVAEIAEICRILKRKPCFKLRKALFKRSFKRIYENKNVFEFYVKKCDIIFYDYFKVLFKFLQILWRSRIHYKSHLNLIDLFFTGCKLCKDHYYWFINLFRRKHRLF